MLIIAGIINYYPKANAVKFSWFANFFRGQHKGDVFDREKQNEYGMHCK